VDTEQHVTGVLDVGDGQGLEELLRVGVASRTEEVVVGARRREGLGED
jgi:hypothetical protein